MPIQAIVYFRGIIINFLYLNILNSFLFTSFIFLNLSVQTQEKVNIVTWNSDDMFCEKDIKSRMELRELANDLTPDVLLLQEVKSAAIVGAIKETMGLADYYHAATNFNQKGNNALDNCKKDRSSFDIGIISKYPITEFYEYTFKLDNPTDQPEKLIPNTAIPNHAGAKSPKRGYLWARLEQIKTIFIGVHLSHSFGNRNCDDYKMSSYQREAVAFSIVIQLKKDLKNFPDYQYVVAGDFNIGISDYKLNGVDLEVDECAGCQVSDCVDETHAILNGQVFFSAPMVSLVVDLDKPTQEDPKYWYMGPIDNMYVMKNTLELFAPAQRGKSRYGSDHWPIFTQMSQ